MTAILDILKIEEDASARLTLAKKTKELQAVVDQLYPGYQVTLTKTDADAIPAQLTIPTDEFFSELTGVAQIETVLRESRDPLGIGQLHDAVSRRGGKMSKSTLMSILSNQKDKKFKRVKRGSWTVPA